MAPACFTSSHFPLHWLWPSLRPLSTTFLLLWQIRKSEPRALKKAFRGHAAGQKHGWTQTLGNLSPFPAPASPVPGPVPIPYHTAPGSSFVVGAVGSYLVPSVIYAQHVWNRALGD